MVSESDLIAIIKIRGGVGEFERKMPSVLKSEVNAEIEKVIFGDPENEKILIKSSPCILKRGVKHSIIVLRDGDYIAFLKNKGANEYCPTTSQSLLLIFNGTVDPVWKISENHPDKQEHYSVDVIFKEILDYM